MKGNVLALRANQRRWTLHERRRGTPVYSLSERFQLQENIRALTVQFLVSQKLQVVRPLIVLAVMGDMLNIGFFSGPELLRLHLLSDSKLYAALFDMLVAL